MIYHVIHRITHEIKALGPADILDLDTDSHGRIVVQGTDKELYFLLASKDLVED